MKVKCTANERSDFSCCFKEWTAEKINKQISASILTKEGKEEDELEKENKGQSDSRERVCKNCCYF